MFQIQSNHYDDGQEDSSYKRHIDQILRQQYKLIGQYLSDPNDKAIQDTHDDVPIQHHHQQPQQPIRQLQMDILPPLPPPPILPPVETLINNRGRRRVNPPKREDYQKNITRDTVHKVAREIQLDPNAQEVIKNKLYYLGINQNQFEDLLKEILRRHQISNALLLRKYLAPTLDDPRRELKQIFSQYFMYYLDEYFAIATEESNQVQKLLTYIKYSRKYLAYLAMTEDGIVSQPSANILNITRK